VNKARVAIGGSRSTIGTVVPLDQTVLESSQEGLEMEVDSDQTARPSLGPAAVSSALPHLLFCFCSSIYRRTGAISVGILPRLFMSAPNASP